MSCDRTAQYTCGQLLQATQIARGGGDAADRCIRVGCDALLYSDRKKCVNGHSQNPAEAVQALVAMQKALVAGEKISSAEQRSLLGINPDLAFGWAGDVAEALADQSLRLQVQEAHRSYTQWDQRDAERAKQAAGPPSRKPSGKLPLEIRGLPPAPDFVRVEHRGEGLPDVHTGGVWHNPAGTHYWKPLDGRPYANADFHLPTQEDECLEMMAGEPGFPRNWRVEEAGEVVVEGVPYTRRWLVREKAWVVQPTDLPDRQAFVQAIYPARRMKMATLRTIEEGLRLLNQRGWSIGDRLSVAITARSAPFILDLSAAHRVNAEHGPPADDTDRFLRWCRERGYEQFVQFRERACSLVDLFRAYDDPDWPRDESGEPDMGYIHVYASKNRPVGGHWAQIEDAHYVEGNPESEGVYTWIVTKDPLSDQKVRDLELTWGWSPIHH